MNKTLRNKCRQNPQEMRFAGAHGSVYGLDRLGGACHGEETMANPKVHEDSGRRVRNSLNRHEIVTAAIQILEQDGADALTVRRIATELQCSVSALYSHFASIDEIVNAMVVHTEEKLARNLRRARRGLASFMEQLSAIARGYWQFALEHPEVHRLMYRKSSQGLPHAYKVYAETFQLGRSAGEFPYSRREISKIARIMFAWLYGLISMELMGISNIEKRGAREIEDGMRYFASILSNQLPFPTLTNLPEPKK